MIKLIHTVTFILAGLFVSAQTHNSIDSKTKLLIDSTYNSLIKKNKVKGTSIAIVHNGEIVYSNGYGFQDEANGIKADDNSIYRIGSCTKSFTALSVMQLQEQKKLKLEEAIQTYLTELKIKTQSNENQPIKIKDVLTHSSGLPSDLMNGFFCDTPPNIDWVIKELNNCVMPASAGYQHSYSNVGYSLLGRMIEKVSNQSYEDYITEHIFAPLGMNATFVDNIGANSNHLSKGYIDGEEYAEPLIRDKAAGLIHSSAIDMAKYINMYLAKGKSKTGEIATQSSVNEMGQNQLTDLVLTTSRGWGYGLYTNDINIISKEDTVNAKIVGHGGDTWAFHADFQFIDELNVGAVILTNSDKGGRVADAKTLLQLYLKSINNTEIEKVKTKKTNATYKEEICKAEDINGFYHFGGMNMTVNNPDKIVIKGPVKIVLNKKNDSLQYTGKVKLLGFIPIKVKHQEFKFVNYADNTYFKVIYSKSKEEDFVSLKSTIEPIPKEWSEKYGTYKAIGGVFECETCKNYNFEGVELSLSEKNGLLIAKLKGKSKDTKRTIYLKSISNRIAVSRGIGRNSGETVKLLENGNIFYSGFEFTKAD